MKDINNALLHIKSKHNGEIPYQYGSRECAQLMDSYAKEYHERQLKLLGIASVIQTEPDYKYEMLIDDEGTPFEINSWIPIATDRIKDPSRIDEYIAKGLIRKRQ